MDEHTIDDDVDARGEVDDGEPGEQMTLVSPSSALPAPNGGVSKRYRPARAKTFQCRGYGECRMVFSRSEHLARHVRKHTGERPFTCHCSKQFSRLDNLRQHAQTVHADRADANERMMRDLGVLHSGMVAAAGGTPATSTKTTTTATTKKTSNRRSRVVAPAAVPAPVPAAAASAALTSRTQEATSPRSPNVKPEPIEPVLGATMPRQRPGTSTGYEGGMEVDREESHTQSTTRRHAPSPPHAAPGRAHSFRGDANDQRSFLGSAGGGADRSGGSQSFRGHPYARRSPPEHTPSPPTHTLSGLPTPRAALHSSGGRPYSSGTGAFQPSPTGSSFPALSGSRPSTGSGTRLPPLSAVVPAAAFRPASGHGLAATGSILLPNSLTLQRPSTSDWEWDSWTGGARPGTAPGKLATAAAAAGDDSPFSFHVPDQPAAPSLFSVGQPRKRTLGGPDGPYGSHPDEGSQSRPTSRRLSVMELLCNDDAVEQQRPGSSSIALSALLGAKSTERPTTTSGLVARASALVLDDPEQREREFESREHAGEQYFAASPFAFGVAAGSRSRSGSLYGGDAVASGRATLAFGRGGSSGGGLSGAATSGSGAGLSAGAGAAARRGTIPSSATSDSIPHAARDGDGDGDVRAAEGGHGYSHSSAGRVSGSASPPGLPGRFSFGAGLSHLPAAAAAAAVHQSQRPRAPSVGGSSGSVSVFARVPPGGVPIRADDPFLGVQRRRDSGVYEYDSYDHDRIGSGRGGGMRV
ncbi:hypothetical protein FB45DRAFT_826335 [Roridomyces roridus]|uniref:C2H2-type domain-containing protein n=1 Tax=Roridomyces roridus TaxID=1738132 RepID=A0AAD7C988_9AGAR|nr:hypothetical protein FB45DRAFT_826335 [Roridomyces roridus]